MNLSPIERPGRGRLWLLGLLLAGCRLASSLCLATMPQPACVFYGEACDEYGWPYVTNATVILRVEGRECSRWTIAGLLAPGVNFMLPLEMDDGIGKAYASYAARPGQAVRISILARGIEQPLVETTALAASQPGDFTSVYVTSGTDTDGDGLPDPWERLLLENSGGAFTDISQIRPEDDFDGDGVSNGDEYRTGTYAFVATDYFYVEELARVANGRLRLRFLTTPGITYQVLATDNLGPASVWQPAPLALAEDETPRYEAVVGDGYYTSLYVEMHATRRFLRLVAR
jgi:hypothetical protein